MPTTKASQKAVNKYIAKSYDRVAVLLKKAESPTKQEVQAAAERADESLNSYIVGAIRQRMEHEQQG